MICGQRGRKLGATRHYSVGGPGHAIKLIVDEDGYQLKIEALLNYNAMTPREAQHAHALLYSALVEALGDAAARRRDNLPLFELEDMEPAKAQPGGQHR